MADKPRTGQELYMLYNLRDKKKIVERPKTREELLILLQIEKKKNERLMRDLENIKMTPMDLTWYVCTYLSLAVDG